MQHFKHSLPFRGKCSGWRIYGLSSFPDTPDPQPVSAGWQEICTRARALGLDALGVPAELLQDSRHAYACVEACKASQLRLMVDVLETGQGASLTPALLEAVEAAQLSIAVLLRGLEERSPAECRSCIQRWCEQHPGVGLTLWTPGMRPEQLVQLEGLNLDGVYASLPWWNNRDAWLVEEFERLRPVAPVFAPVGDPRRPDPVSSAPALSRRLAVATVVGESVLIPAAVADRLGRERIAECEWFKQRPLSVGRGLRRLTGPLSPVTAICRVDDGRRLLLINPDEHVPATIHRSLIERRLPYGFVLDRQGDADSFRIEPGGWLFVPLKHAEWIAKYGTSSRQQRVSLTNALRAPRIAIEAVRPVVDEGRFAVKRTLGETVTISTNLFMDGHEQLAAEVLWRPVNESEWVRTPLMALGNDAWEARILPRKLGRYIFTLRAWVDTWQSYRTGLQKKHDAGLDVGLEVEEGRRLLRGLLERARKIDEASAAIIETALDSLGWPRDTGAARKMRPRPGGPRVLPSEAQHTVSIPLVRPEHVQTLEDDVLAAAVAAVAEPAFETFATMEYPISIERNEAVFSNWYELFPRSQSPEPGRHGTFRDVIARLPDIRRMGFDVLYFPPIHPIGERNRKGRNNSLTAEPGDPGSPYAIGSEAGGHDAVHPELGSLSDFRDLVTAAHQHGLEIALDFAIQCSPDHPWLREHPDWFNWRVDGTLKYAENPPKRYEDIVNPDFYSPLASTPRQAALWRALRDIVIFWIHQGIRIFRVDNPHTKPLPFWEWMLGEVRDRHPDTIFLSEAFTRPAMMYRLAKVGFSQSYTYFTWRNTKQELTDYLTELNGAPVRDFFRPNFFVNTPDINPWFLQTSGRAGFLIRAVLAGTLSGSWGMYNGFELCEAAAVPGKEEYLDSEKYQLRQWDLNAPGNIIPEITKLNRIRRSHPALQSHLGVRFHPVDNDRILFYSRHSAEGDSVVLVAVSLDPHHRQTGRLELPLHEWGIGEDGSLPFHDLFEDLRFRLQGRWQYIELTPERPFVIWARVLEQGTTE